MGCNFCLQRYKWRHDSVLLTMKPLLEKRISAHNASRPRSNVITPLSSSFVVPGRAKPTSTTTRQRTHSLSDANDWQILIDFDHNRMVFPPEICSTDQRPDIVIWSTNSKTVLVIELTCPPEENILTAQTYKEKRYAIIPELARNNKWKVTVITIEAGARGFV